MVLWSNKKETANMGLMCCICLTVDFNGSEAVNFFYLLNLVHL